jgi:hypothetical protein
MSDVTITPSNVPTNQPSSTPQTTNAPSQVPVDTDRSSTPHPLGPQAPSVPEGEKRTPSRMEAIQAAFDRANKPKGQAEKPAEKPAPKAAEAKAGHNQPPEETPKLNLKKRPDDQGQPQPRSERGQFAPRPRDESQVGIVGVPGHAQQNAPNGQPVQPVRQLPETAPFRDPPPRMAEHAKRDWAAAPESVRGEIHRMHEEFGRAYNFYRADHEAFKPLRSFHQLAQSQGTTLDRALNNYVSMEQKLRTDLLGGLDLIVHNMGLQDPQTGRRLDLRDVAYTVLSQSPEQLQQMKQGNAQNAASQQIGALHQEINGLKGHLQQLHTERQFQYTRSQIDQFADDGRHPRFDELGDLIKNEINLGFDLESAYRRAELLRPASQAAQTRNPSAQTRTTTDRSIYGAPSDVTASNAASRRPKTPSGSVSDAVSKAFRSFNGAAS